MTDEMIAALGRKHGVVQINFSCDFLNPEVFAENEKNREQFVKLRDALAGKYAGDPGGLQKAFREARAAVGMSAKRATLADVVKHINHVVQIAGIDAVGLGSDFDGIGCAPEGLDSVDKWPNLTRALLEEGYIAPEIRKIYGENFLRLFSEVERTAKTLSAADERR
jgi:membrane dipeptidase